MVVFLALMASYIIVGSVYNMQTKKVAGVDALPHPEFWKAGYNLVIDGFFYTRSRLRGGVGGGSTYEALPAAASGSGGKKERVEAPAGQRLEEAQAAMRSSGSSGGKTKGGDKSSLSRERTKEKKAKKEKHSKSSRKDESSDGKSKSKSKSRRRDLSLEDKGRAVTEQVHGFAAVVMEKRDSQVHSSQAKVEVISLSSAT